MNSIKGKKIIYITKPLFEYISVINNEMLLQGAEVKIYIPKDMKLWDSIIPDFITPLHRRRQEAFLTKCMNDILHNEDTYSDIFIQNPHLLGEKNLEILRSHFKSARFILYNWDPVIRYETNKYFQYFDKIITFDHADAVTYNLVYLPLFFTKDFDNIYKNRNMSSGKKKKYSITFIGKAADHEERYPWIQDIIRYCIKENITYYVFLHITVKRYVKYLLKGKILKNVGFRSLSLKQIAQVYYDSISVIDHPNPIQHGLTMRTFEVLGSGCRLITTNNNILSEPFFDKKYISLFKLSLGELVSTQLNEPASRPDNFEEYRIDNWVKKIFE